MMQKIKKSIQEAFNCKILINKEKSTGSENSMEKLLFVEIINLLREADDRGAMLEAFGLDLQEYDNLYHSVIHNLLRLHFNEAQIELIEYYVYQLPLQEDFNGKLEIKKGRKVVEYDFETPEHLWHVLKEVK